MPEKRIPFQGGSHGHTYPGSKMMPVEKFRNHVTRAWPDRTYGSFPGARSVLKKRHRKKARQWRKAIIDE